MLAGGETPRALYQVLASSFRESIRWRDIHVFWGDERYVPHTDPRSNYRMARETLLEAQTQDPGNSYIKNNLELLEASVRKNKATQ